MGCSAYRIFRYAYCQTYDSAVDYIPSVTGQNGRAGFPIPPLLDVPREPPYDQFLHAAFCFGHGAHGFWTWGVFISSWGVLPPDREGQRPRCPIRRHTGRGGVPAARFVVAPPIFLLSSHADGV